MKAFPNTVDDLLAELDRIFPEPVIAADTSMDEIKYDAGQRSVVLFLKKWRANPQQEAAPPRRGAGRGRVHR